MALILSEKEDGEFKQSILIIVNLVWLLLEHLYLDWSTPLKFRIVRCIYFGFLGITRIDLFDSSDIDENFWPKLCKMIKVLLIDFISMVFLIWAFGRSIMYPISILECAFVLVMMFIPERTFSPHSSFLWHITLR